MIQSPNLCAMSYEGIYGQQATPSPNEEDSMREEYVYQTEEVNPEFEAGLHLLLRTQTGQTYLGVVKENGLSGWVQLFPVLELQMVVGQAGSGLISAGGQPQAAIQHIPIPVPSLDGIHLRTKSIISHSRPEVGLSKLLEQVANGQS